MLPAASWGCRSDSEVCAPRTAACAAAAADDAPLLQRALPLRRRLLRCSSRLQPSPRCPGGLRRHSSTTRRQAWLERVHTGESRQAGARPLPSSRPFPLNVDLVAHGIDLWLCVVRCTRL